MNLIALHFLFSIQFFVLVMFGDRYILFYDRHNLIDAGHFDRKVKKNIISRLVQYIIATMFLNLSLCCFFSQAEVIISKHVERRRQERLDDPGIIIYVSFVLLGERCTEHVN